MRTRIFAQTHIHNYIRIYCCVHTNMSVKHVHIHTYITRTLHSHTHQLMHTPRRMGMHLRAHSSTHISSIHTYICSVMYAHLLLRTHGLYVRARILCTSHTHLRVPRYIYMHVLLWTFHLPTCACTFVLSTRAHLYAQHSYANTPTPRVTYTYSQIDSLQS